MSLLKSIIEAQGGQVLKQVGTNFNLDGQQTTRAISQLLPALLNGLKQNTRKPGGLEDLLGALKRGKHDRYLENPSAITQRSTIEDGNGILGHILGSKEVSRHVAREASVNTGIDVGILKKMLPMVAAMTMGGMSKQAQKADQQLPGGLGSIFGGIGASGQRRAPQPQAAPEEGAESIFGKLLDADNDGSVLDDVMGMAKKLF